jgi:hypothetical protein
LASKRPFKVRFHNDGTRRTDPETGLTWIDHSAPIDGMESFTSVDSALVFGRTVSRAGGRAEVFHRELTTETDTPIRVCEPYEDVLRELTEEVPQP